MAENNTTKIVRLEEQMKNIEVKVDKGFADLSLKIDTLREQGTILQRLTFRVEEAEKEITELKRRRTFLNWALPLVGTLVGGTFVFLLNEYLTNK